MTWKDFGKILRNLGQNPTEKDLEDIRIDRILQFGKNGKKRLINSFIGKNYGGQDFRQQARFSALLSAEILSDPLKPIFSTLPIQERKNRVAFQASYLSDKFATTNPKIGSIGPFLRILKP